MPDSRPNILVIWGDDVGTTNLSCYSHGVMGYRTPNIDRLAREGMLFTDASEARHLLHESCQPRQHVGHADKPRGDQLAGE